MLNLTFRNKSTDLRMGITNPAVMRIEKTGGRNSQSVTYFARDIIQACDTIFWGHSLS